MFNGSHSRQSYPFDKRVPIMRGKRERHLTPDGYAYMEGFTSGMRQEEKKMHKKKQRQHDRKLSREWFGEEKEKINTTEGAVAH